MDSAVQLCRCNNCGGVTARPIGLSAFGFIRRIFALTCHICGHRVAQNDSLQVHNPLAILGMPGAGTSSYLSRLYTASLSLPEVRVDTTTDAFKRLTRVDSRWDSVWGHSLAPLLPGCFCPMTFAVGRRTSHLVAFEDRPSLDSKRVRDSLPLIRLCEGIMVVVGSEGLLGPENREQLLGAMQLWSEWARELFANRHSVKRMVVILSKVDLLGTNAVDASARAHEASAPCLATFQGLLRNEGIEVQIVPTSSVGFREPTVADERTRFPSDTLPFNCSAPLEYLLFGQTLGPVSNMARTDAPRMRARQKDRPGWDVALSFAGEDRGYVEEVANRLASAGITVFYDRHAHVEMWGKDLAAELGHIYSRARFVVLFASKHYATKAWTTHERQHAQAAAIGSQVEKILPARFDDTPIPGLPSTISYVDLRIVKPSELAELIVLKVQQRSEG